MATTDVTTDLVEETWEKIITSGSRSPELETRAWGLEEVARPLDYDEQQTLIRAMKTLEAELAEIRKDSCYLERARDEQAMKLRLMVMANDRYMAESAVRSKNFEAVVQQYKSDNRDLKRQLEDVNAELARKSRGFEEYITFQEEKLRQSEEHCKTSLVEIEVRYSEKVQTIENKLRDAEIAYKKRTTEDRRVAGNAMLNVGKKLHDVKATGARLSSELAAKERRISQLEDEAKVRSDSLNDECQKRRNVESDLAKWTSKAQAEKSTKSALQSKVNMLEQRMDEMQKCNHDLEKRAMEYQRKEALSQAFATKTSKLYGETHKALQLAETACATLTDEVCSLRRTLAEAKSNEESTRSQYEAESTSLKHFISAQSKQYRENGKDMAKKLKVAVAACNHLKVEISQERQINKELSERILALEGQTQAATAIDQLGPSPMIIDAEGDAWEHPDVPGAFR